jgi:hypothetical protein
VPAVEPDEARRCHDPHPAQAVLLLLIQHDIFTGPTGWSGPKGPLLQVDRTGRLRIARLAGGEVRPVRLAAGLSPQQAARQVMRALHQPRTVSGVLASGEPSRPLWQRVTQQSAKPIVLVPAEARDQPPRIRRILLPLDGTIRSASAVAGTAEQLARSGAELVVLHVFDAQTVPKFWNQHAHAGQAWEQEFLARRSWRSRAAVLPGPDGRRRRPAVPGHPGTSRQADARAAGTGAP